MNYNQTLLYGYPLNTDTSLQSTLALRTPRYNGHPDNTGFVLFWALQIPWPIMTFSMTFFTFTWPQVWLSFSIIFENFTFFSIFLALKQFNRNKLWYTPKCVPFALFNYSSFSCVILALSSAVTNLPHKGQNFKFPWLSRTDNEIPWLEIRKFNDFPGFPWPVRTL